MAEVELSTTPEIRTLEKLRPIVGSTAVTLCGFFAYNAVDFPAGVREPMLAHDAGSAVICGLAWVLLRKKLVPASWGHALGFSLVLLVVSNILLAMWLLRAPYYVLYVDLVILGAGLAMSLPAWAVVTVGGVCAVSFPLLYGLGSDAVNIGRYAATLVVSSALALAIFVGRLRVDRHLAELIVRDEVQRNALETALADLDAKVAARTTALEASNAALRHQIDERERAERAARDLTDQLRHAQRLESLGRLAGGIAHDFNNLLTVVTANVDHALAELPANVDREPLEETLGAARRASELTRQLLAFSRKQVLAAEVLDLGARVEGLGSMLHRALGESVALEIRAGAAAPIEADPTLVEQVVMNLAVNAKDAMPEGGQLTISVDRVRRDDTDAVRLRVEDTGVGIDAEALEHVFEPFFTTKEVGKGTGLGLSTVYGIAQQHGGSVSVSSAPGAGTRFDVYFPMSTRLPAAKRREEAPRSASTGHERVLLVEDQDAVRRVAERILQRHGYEVLAAASGAEALELAERLEGHIDLLFTDVMMPGMNGVELAKRLLALRADVKVLFASGYTGDYLSAHAELRIGNNLVYKPYQGEALARRVREILDSESSEETFLES